MDVVRASIGRDITNTGINGCHDGSGWVPAGLVSDALPTRATSDGTHTNIAGVPLSTCKYLRSGYQTKIDRCHRSRVDTVSARVWMRARLAQCSKLVTHKITITNGVPTIKHRWVHGRIARPGERQSQNTSTMTSSSSVRVPLLT